MMKLEFLRMQNFLSHEATLLSLKQYNGLTLIEGKNADAHYSSNGSGKSTILEGVYYAFTGKTMRGLTADSVVNRVNKKDTLVKLDFLIGQSMYTIERYRKDTVHGNNLYLYQDGKNLSKRTPTETQKLIDDIVPAEGLLNVMIMGEGLSSRFTSLPDPSKKALLESTIVLSHDIVKSLEAAKAALSKSTASMNQTDGQLLSLTRLQETLRQAHDAPVESLVAEKEGYEAQVGELQAQSSELVAESQEVSGKLSVIEKALNNIQNLRTNLTYQKSLEQQHLTAQQQVNSAPEIECPTCRQKVVQGSGASEAVKIYYQNLLEGVQQSIAQIETQLAELPAQELLEQKGAELRSIVGEVQGKLATFNTQINELFGKVTELKSKIDQRTQSASQLQGLADEEDELRAQLEGFKLDAADFEYISKKVFSATGVLTDVLASVVDYINVRMRVYTDLMLDKSFQLTFEKGKISLESGDADVSYSSLSNGERRRLDLCIQFSLHDYVYAHRGIGIDTLFIDEVLDTLDQVGVTNIIELLNIKMKYCHLERLFVVTHNQELARYFDGKLVVEKDKRGLTRIAN